MGPRALALMAVALWLALAAPARAATADPAAEDPVLEQRLAVLSAELRCLVCQNQSLADSHAELAIDLRNQVRDLMRAGRSDDEIKDYLTRRYGDFVLYRPPVKASTALLWAGPFALLLLGVLALWFTLRARRARLEAGAAPDTDARERARALLRQGGGGPESNPPSPGDPAP